MRPSSTFLFLAVATACVVGCSSDPEDPGASTTTGSAGGDRVVRVDVIRSQIRPIVDADCQWQFRCCNADERAQQLGPVSNVADCVDRALDAATHQEYSYGSAQVGSASAPLLRELNRLAYGFDLGRVTVDAAAVQACITKLAARACTAVPPKDHCAPPAEVPPIDDPCELRKLLVGRQKVGEPCAPSSTDCQPDLRCSVLDGDDGVCVSLAHLNDTCFQDRECEQKLVCDNRKGRCVQGGDVGAACSFTDPAHPAPELTADRCRPGLACDTVLLKCGGPTCAGGSYCSADTQCPVGTSCVHSRCSKPAKDGEPCNADKECENKKCSYEPTRGGQFCVGPSPIGALCNGDDQACASHYCLYTSGQYLCTAQVADGAPCPGGDRQCVSERCRAGGTGPTCAPAAAVGKVCADDQDCSPAARLYCVGLKCAAAPLDNGAPCSQADQCKSQLCLASKCSAKQGAGAPCGAGTTAPCDTGLYCNSIPGLAGTCVQKKPQGGLCQRSDECFSSCNASFGVMRCQGVGDGAVCKGAP